MSKAEYFKEKGLKNNYFYLCMAHFEVEHLKHKYVIHYIFDNLKLDHILM